MPHLRDGVFTTDLFQRYQRTETRWSAFFVGLRARGLRDVELVVSDDHQGRVKAIRQQFQGVLWQRCQTHFLRNLAACTPAALQAELLARASAVLTAPDRKTAKVLLDTLAHRRCPDRVGQYPEVGRHL